LMRITSVAMSTTSDPALVVWLVRDTCRVTDNPALARAIKEARRAQATVVALACLEPRRWTDSQFGLARSGRDWRRFRAESLLVLRESFEEIGGTLWIDADAPVEVLSRILKSHSVVSVVTDLPVASEEEAENAALAALDLQVIAAPADELFDSSQIIMALDQLPSSFTKFRKTIEEKHRAEPLPPIAISSLDGSPAQPWPDPKALAESLGYSISDMTEVEARGGERAANDLWNAYLASGALSSYKKTRNAFSGRTNSSHLSAWLAHGCLSVRAVWHDILYYEQSHGANESTYWLRFELLWREFFRWYARNVGSRLFRRSGPTRRALDVTVNPEAFAQWREGVTGMDIVDASMRELQATGWISNRARQLVASYLIYEAGLDWRLGAAWFESRLVDFDVASNWGNWAYIAGVGPDPRGGRIFNLELQAERYDPEHSYRKRWLSI
jgi:deoxyribodipyrimidine photo-lyase